MILMTTSSKDQDNKWHCDADVAYNLLRNIDFKAVNIDSKNVESIKHFVKSTLPFFYSDHENMACYEDAIKSIENDIVLNNEHKSDEILDWLEQCTKRVLAHVNGPTHQIFSVIAGRLLLIHMYFEYCRLHNTRLPYENLIQHIHFVTEKGIYNSSLKEYVNFMPQLSLHRDLLFDYTSLKHFKKSYINSINNYCCELPQHVFIFVSAYFAYQQNDRDKSAAIFYDLISLKKLSLATPMLANLRTKRHGNLASCFIIKADDNIDNMFYNIYCIANISKNGGGIGISLSRLRSEGADVGDRSNAACGVVHFVKIINDTSLTVNQGGRRSAAITVALDVWHRDILTFLEMQTESGDVRKKAFDIFPQVVVNDVFMKCVEQNISWTIFDPEEIRKSFNIELDLLNGDEFEKVYNFLLQKIADGEIKLYAHISALELMKRIMRAQIETGLPYIFFKDSANKFNANKHDGQIPCGNLCQESFSNVKHSIIRREGDTITTSGGYAHTCNLLSLNLSNILSEDVLEQSVRQAVRILDASIDIGDPVAEESRNHNNRYRTIGIGALGLHDHLAFMRISYAQASSYVSDLFERILFYALSESNILAIEKGSYPAFQGSEWSKGIILQKTEEDLAKSNLNWKELLNNIKIHGLRNGHLISIAPNTSSAIIQNASASVLPVHKNFFLDNNSRGITSIFSLYYNSRMKFYDEYASIPIDDVINVISNIQQWTDQGISFELIFDLNKNTKASHIFNAIMKIWKKGCKTIYYLRTLQKRVKEVHCESCTL